MSGQQIQDLIDRGALFVVNHSGGKDSQAMFLTIRQRVPASQIIVVHAHLPDVEWDGTIEHIRKTTDGFPLHVCQASKTFFDMVEARGMFPSPKYRQCTSDLKRGPIEKLIRRICRETGNRLIVNCMGLRAEESASRAKQQTFKKSARNSKAGREWYDWLPIFDLLVDEVFAIITDAGQEPFWCYAAGMSRKSCCFCIMSCEADLKTAGRLRPDLARRIAATERRFDQTMLMPAADGTRTFLDELLDLGDPVDRFMDRVHGATEAPPSDDCHGLVVSDFDIVAACTPKPVTVLSFGGGVDSTAILALRLFPNAGARVLGITADQLDRALPAIDHVVFADTGAESRRTYRNVETARRLCANAGVPFTVVRKRDRDGNVYRIQDHHLRLGTVPVMPGGGHVCSIKFKQDVIRQWRVATFGDRPVIDLIGYEDNERTRCAKAGRFKPEAGRHQRYPLIALGLDRDRCAALLAALWPHEVVKSSCVFCPFMTEAEIEDLYWNEPEGWRLACDLEDALKRESDRKHGAYLAAMAAHRADPIANPSPLNKAGKCKTGFWSRHSWNDGLRVFWARQIEGRALSMAEWAARFEARHAATKTPAKPSLRLVIDNGLHVRGPSKADAIGKAVLVGMPPNPHPPVRRRILRRRNPPWQTPSLRASEGAPGPTPSPISGPRPSPCTGPANHTGLPCSAPWPMRSTPSPPSSGCRSPRSTASLKPWSWHGPWAATSAPAAPPGVPTPRPCATWTKPNWPR